MGAARRCCRRPTPRDPETARAAAAMRACCANSTSPPRRFAPTGFVSPEAKSGANWLDRDTAALSSALGEGMATRSGYARTVRLWRRGTTFRGRAEVVHSRLRSKRIAVGAAAWIVRSIRRAGIRHRAPSFFETTLVRIRRASSRVSVAAQTHGRTTRRLVAVEAAQPVDDRRTRPIPPTRCWGSGFHASSTAPAISRFCSRRPKGGRCRDISGAGDKLVVSTLDDCAAIRTPHARGRGWTFGEDPGPARNRRRRHLAALDARRIGEQRRKRSSLCRTR